ncbi:hypothetical protein Tco_0721139 [Tanacetum coccineum]
MRAYRQEEGIDFEESFTLVARMEATRYLWLTLHTNLSRLPNGRENYFLTRFIKKHGIKHCDPIGTPMDTKHKLDLDTNRTHMDAMRYRRMIGFLMHLTSSKPDIIHNTCLCARYQAQPTEKHLKEDVRKPSRVLPEELSS